MRPIELRTQRFPSFLSARARISPSSDVRLLIRLRHNSSENYLRACHEIFEHQYQLVKRSFLCSESSVSFQNGRGHIFGREPKQFKRCTVSSVVDYGRRPLELKFEVSTSAWLARIRGVLYNTTLGEGWYLRDKTSTAQCFLWGTEICRSSSRFLNIETFYRERQWIGWRDERVND